MEMCKNCRGILIEDEGKWVHRYTTNCKIPVVMDLIGLHFLDSYFEFEIKKRHLDDDKFYCDGVGANNLKGRVYEKGFIIKNSIT